MGSMTLDIDGWYKKSNSAKPEPIHPVHFHISEACHLQLEAAEVELQKTHQPEKFLDVDMESFDLELPPDIGPLSDCQLRVYINPKTERGHFHLVGHRASDNSLVYSNAVMVEHLI